MALSLVAPLMTDAVLAAPTDPLETSFTSLPEDASLPGFVGNAPSY